MNYYLKYLKYKQKYLDLKNLDLIGGLSLSYNNYDDLEGGVLNFKSDIELENSHDHYNIREITKLWKNTGVSEISYSEQQPGYYLMYPQRLTCVGRRGNEKEPQEICFYNADTGNDDIDNHIHVLTSTIEDIFIKKTRIKEKFICIHFCLKINGFGVVVPNETIETIKNNLNNGHTLKQKELIIGKILDDLRFYRRTGEAKNQVYKIKLTSSHNDGKLSKAELLELCEYLKLQSLVCLVLKNKQEILINETIDPEKLAALENQQKLFRKQEEEANKKEEEGIDEALKYLQLSNHFATREQAREFYIRTKYLETRRERDINRIFNDLKRSGMTMDDDALKLHAISIYNNELADEAGYNLYDIDEYKALQGENSSRSGNGYGHDSGPSSGYGPGPSSGYGPGPSSGHDHDRDRPGPSSGYGPGPSSGYGSGRGYARDSGPSSSSGRGYARDSGRERDYGRDSDREPASDSGSGPYNRDRDKRPK